MSKKIFVIVSMVLVLGMILTACRPTTTPAPAAEPAQVTEPEVAEPVVSEPTSAPAPTQAPASTSQKTQIRWYVGLGAGSDEPTFAAQEQVVADYNASQDKIELILEIVDNTVAYDTLATQIAAGNAPDIVGPAGIRGRDSFKGAWLDLRPLIDKFNYDLSDFDPGMVEFYLVEEEQLGLPFAVFPSYLFVNKELFDEAGLPYPPQEWGAPYVDENGVEKPWDMDTLREVALKLTVDANGIDATSPDFDNTQIVQFGFGEQWTDPRGHATFFGSGSFVDGNGKAQIPDNWRAAWKWFYEAKWTDFFSPNAAYGNSDIMGAGNWFQSGNLAMAHVHLWYAACCMSELEAEWDTAALPSYNGVITAKMHADTFEIPKGSKHPDEAFEVLTYLLGPAADKLTKIYGGMPARISLQDKYFDEFSAEVFPGQDINWDVVVEAMAYADNPNHESWMPSFLETTDRYNEFWNLIDNNPGVDVDAEMDKLLIDLNKIFAAASQ